MGILSGDITIENKTPYKWTTCIEIQMPLFLPDQYGEHFHFDANETKYQTAVIPITTGKDIFLNVKYGHCSQSECYKHPDLWYKFDPKDDPTFTIRESGDRSDIHLDINRPYEKRKTPCPNYGKEEDDARQRREMERQERERQRAQRKREQRIEEQRKEDEARQRRERERQERERQRAQREREQRIEQQRKEEKERRERERKQREREQRIERQIKEESKISAMKLSLANENLKQKQLLRSQESQQIQIMQKPMEMYQIDEAEAIEEKFSELMLIYEITENEDPQESLAERMNFLQTEIMVEYCKKHGLSSSCLLNFEAAFGYDSLSLNDRLSVLEAVLYVALEESEDDGQHHNNKDFMFNVIELLHDTHPSLAWSVLQNYLHTDVELSVQSKEILSQMVFSNVWTPAEIIDFVHKISGKDKEQVYSVLHMAQTYKLKYSSVTKALQKREPLRSLQRHVNNEKHKDAETILKEMQEAKIPDKVLVVLEDVLFQLEKELPNYEGTDLNEEGIQFLKDIIKSLDFRNPNTEVLKWTLIGISVAVKLCSTISILRDGKIMKIEGYIPRLTQLATLLIFLLPKSETNTGCLLEIGTGEGKSCILAMLSLVHAIRGENVDLVTSSPVLARRDLEEWKELYDMFGITSSVIPPPLNDAPPEQQEELIQDAYKQQIIYSTVGTFAADTLRQEFEKTITRGERRFDLVLVDEVDYMTLDNGVQITYLSHESSGLQHLEQVLASIWATVSACRPIQLAETGEIMWTTRVQSFHMAAMLATIGSESSDKFSPLDILLPGIDLGIYSQEEFTKLKAVISAGDKELTKVSLEDDTWKAIMDKTGVEEQYALLGVLEMGLEDKVAFHCYEFQSGNGKAVYFGEKKAETDQNTNMLLLEKGKACEIMQEDLLVDATVEELRCKIKYSDQQMNKDQEETMIVVPFYLKEYMEKQLPVFVENALKAIQMTNGREYMIERSGRAQGMNVTDEEQHIYDTIIPLDFQASGILEKQKRWGDGLQQFLEMKHQLTLSPLTNVTNYMSNLSFFKRYLSGKGIFGVSGTLGGDADKSFLERHYKTDSYVIPAHQRKKVTELPPVQVRGGTEEWFLRICQTVSKVSDRGQVVLVVCEDVNTANTLNKKITSNSQHPVTLYTMSERHSIENKEFTEGEIIISTNLGGRGTDIKVTEEVNHQGGLFVILTYFPNNRRVEQQVFGRTGRKGTPGMVQLILNHDHLAEAYQGNSVEVMRELREEHEINRISDMERETLVEIEMKEELFFTFCEFLSKFDKHYSKEEKTDLFEVKVKDIPRYFESCDNKMDYHPALNALKESWGVWLILHTDQINKQSDIGKLKGDLIQHLKDTSQNLIQGNSANFYDHIQEAIGRTALHFQNKKCDYGAKFYWEKVSKSDSYYRAVALYNQAYITISMARENYKNKAHSLLEEADKAIEVYVSETSNTLGFVSMSVSGDFEPHHTGSCNLQTQMQARMNIFNSWKKNIQKILNMLESWDGDVTTEESSLYSLLSHENFVSASELSLFRNYGLAIVFEVKQKPRFSYDALICCFLGLAQVVAGVLLCTLSAGALSSFGLGLISEGVSDMISGIVGMINGTFSWASWAISKAISIGISLACGGFRAIKSAYSSVKNAAKGILDGTKSLRGVACSAVKSGKQLFVSAYKAVRTLPSSMGTKSLSSLFTSNAAKLALKNASKYAVQELAIQGANTLVNKAIDATVQKTLKAVLHEKFKDSVHSALKTNKKFVKEIRRFIISTVPKTAMITRPDNYKIDKDLEMNIKEHVNSQMNCTISHLLKSCAELLRVVNTLSQVWDGAVQEFPKHISHNTHKYIKALLTTTKYSAQIYELYSSIPTESTINEQFVPAFLKALSTDSSLESCDEDGKHMLKEVERLTCELVDFISEGLSQAMIEHFSGSATSIFTTTFSQKLNSATGKVVGNLLKRHETQDFFDNQQHYNDLKSTKERTAESLSETEKTEILQYAYSVTDEQNPATGLELHVLTQSDLIGGKGICVTVVDAKGNLLSEETYPGTDPKSGTIKLVLTKSPLDSQKKGGFFDGLKSRIKGETASHTGHFDIIHSDGSREAVNSEKQNCLFQAVVQSTSKGSDPNVLKQKATELRSKVGEEIVSNPGKYVKAVKIQTMFDRTNPCSKFKMEAGARTPEDIKKYFSKIRNLREEDIINGYMLGKVGEHNELLADEKLSKSVTEADHIPPKSTLSGAFQRLQKNRGIADELKRNNKSLYDLAMSVKDDQNGKNQLCMNTLYFDHIRALSTGNSRESSVGRSLLVKAFTGGDADQLMKLSFMMAHPQCSDNIRNDLGIRRNFTHQNSGLSDDLRNQYYKSGFKNMVNEYHTRGIIDQNQSKNMMDWVDSEQYLNRNTSEYKYVINQVSNKLSHSRNRI